MIDNIKLNHVNKLADELFNSDELFFMVVGKPE